MSNGVRDTVVRGRARALLSFTVFVVSLLGAHVSRAAVIVVDQSTCNLIDAIVAANNDSPSGGCPAGAGADVIELTADVTLTGIYATTPEYGPVGLPILNSDITLKGDSHKISRSTSAPLFRLMIVGDLASVELQDASLRYGYADGLEGGAVLNLGQLTLRRMEIRNNSAGFGGAIATHGFLVVDSSDLQSNWSAIDGGGIANYGTAHVTKSSLAANNASGNGGGIYCFRGDLTLTNSTLSGNTAGGFGGGISGVGPDDSETYLGISYSTIANNHSGDSGGGIYLDHRTAQLSGTLLSNNQPDQGNCGFDLGSIVDLGLNLDDDGTCSTGFGVLTGLEPILTANGGYAPTHALLVGSSAIDAGGDCGLAVDQRGVSRDDGKCDSGAYEVGCCGGRIMVDEQSCTLIDAIKSANSNRPIGGCESGQRPGPNTIVLTANATLDRRVGQVSGYRHIGLPALNTAIILHGQGHVISKGGGATFRLMAVGSDGLVELNDVTFRGGDSDSHGGAILNLGNLTLTRTIVADSSGHYGGGIANHGTLFLESSRVYGNWARYDGGGIANYSVAQLTRSLVMGNNALEDGGGVFTELGELALTNSTVSLNSATVHGGGIRAIGSGQGPVDIELRHCTLSGNNSNDAGGGIYLELQTASMQGCILANHGSTPGSCVVDMGSVVDLGGNFDDDGTCGAGFAEITGLDPTLRPSGDGTLTHALFPDSNAIDAAGVCGLETDQRWLSRNDDACDSGAHEFQCSIQIDSDDQATLVRYTPLDDSFDLVSGDLLDLHLNRDFSGAICVGADLTSPAIDPSPPPQPGAGRYYLARGLASCVGAGYGSSSPEPDPRGELIAGPCP